MVHCPDLIRVNRVGLDSAQVDSTGTKSYTEELLICVCISEYVLAVGGIRRDIVPVGLCATKSRQFSNHFFLPLNLCGYTCVCLI